MDTVSWGNTTVCRYLQGIHFHIQRNDGAKTTWILFPYRNCYGYNDVLQKNMKAMFCSLDGETTFFDIVTEVLQGDHILCLDYVLELSIDLIKENSFTVKKDKKQTISGKNYDRHSLCRWSSTSCKYTSPSRILLHWQEQAARKTQIKQTSKKDPSKLLVTHFTYLDSNISSTESDINISLLKVWNAIDRLLIIRISHLSNKIKQDFFQTVAVSLLLYGC